MAKIRGADKHKRRLARMRSPVMVQEVTRVLFGCAQDIVVDAQISITEGAVSGKFHVPSLPGEPPNADTHVLSNNIEASSPGPLRAEASSNAPYAAAQEFGSESQHLAERPYMRPATEKNRDKINRRIVAVVDKVTQASV